MSQSSRLYNEDDGADALPLDTEDRASTNLRSPDFQFPKEEALPAPATSFGTSLAGPLANYTPSAELPRATSDRSADIPQPLPETSVESSGQPTDQQGVEQASRLAGAESPEVAQAIASLGQGPEPMPTLHRGPAENWLREAARREREYPAQQAGIHSYLASKGLQTELRPDGSHAIATHEDGAPMWKPTRSQPFNDPETGRPVVRERDDRGNLKDVDLFSTKGIVHTDADGNRYYMGPGNQPVDLNSPDPVFLEHKKVKELRSTLYAQENEARYRAAKLHEEVIAPAQEMVKQFQKAPAIESNGLDRHSKSMKAVENTIASLMPSRENGSIGEDQSAELDAALEAKAKFHQNNPEYGPAMDTLKGANAEVKRLKAQASADYHRRITSILHPDASAAMIAGLPDTMASRGEEPQPGSVDPAEVAHDTAMAAAQQGTTQSRALVSVLKRYRANGAQTVGEQPIEEAIRAAQNPPKRVPKAVEPEPKAPETAGFLSSAGATIRKAMYDTAATGTDAAGTAVGTLTQNPYGDEPAFLRDNQPRLDAARARLKEIASPAGSVARGVGSLAMLATGAGQPLMGAEEASLIQKINRLTMNPGWAEAVRNLQKEGAASYDQYGISPAAGNPLAQIGRGAGGFLAAVPAMYTGLGVTPALAQMAGNAYEAKYAEVEKAAPKDADPDEVHDQAQHAAMREAVKQAPQLIAYLYGGKAASAAVGKLLPAAGPLAKAVAGGVAHTAANMAVGAGTRALEGQPIAPTIEGTTMDALFGGIGAMETHHGATELEKHVATALAIRDQATPTGGQTVDPAQQKLAADFLAKQNPRLVAKMEARMQKVADSAETQSKTQTASQPTSSPAQSQQSGEAEQGDIPSPEPAPTSPSGQAKAFSSRLKSSDELAPAIETAGTDNPVATQLRDEQNGHQQALHKAQADAVASVPEPVRQRVASILGTDGLANEAHFAGDTDAGFQAAHVGRELRDVYTTPEQQAAIEHVKAQASEHGPTVEFIADQHAGMLAAKDLLAIATGKGEVDPERVAQLGRLGLVEPGEDGTPHVTHDALPLLPKGFTGRLLTAHDNYRVKSLHGEKLAGAAAMVRGGQEQLANALHAKALHVREQAAPQTYHVRVEFTDQEGQQREQIIRGRGQSEEQGMAHAMATAEKRGMKVTHAEVTTPEKEQARKAETKVKADPLARSKVVYRDAKLEDFTPEERQAMKDVEREFQRNRALFKQFGIEGIQPARAEGEASGLATSEGKLSVDGGKLLEQFQTVKDRGGDPKQWVRRALIEEIVHQATIKGLGPKWRVKLEAVWVDEKVPQEMRDAAAKAYDGFDQLDDHQKAAELVRMVVQGEWKGTITEQIFNAIKDLHAYLLGIDAKGSPLLQEAIDQTRAVLTEARRRVVEERRASREEASRLARTDERASGNSPPESRKPAEPPASSTPVNSKSSGPDQDAARAGDGTSVNIHRGHTLETVSASEARTLNEARIAREQREQRYDHLNSRMRELADESRHEPTDERRAEITKEYTAAKADRDALNEDEPDSLSASKAKREAILATYEAASKKAGEDNTPQVHHEPATEDTVEAWYINSKSKGNSHEALIYPNGDGTFSVRNEHDMDLGSGQESSLEDALQEGRWHVEASSNQAENDAALEARQELIHSLAVPQGWEVDQVQDTKWGSIYYKLKRQIGEDANGEPEYDTYKLSIRDHEPSPFREKEFGKSDWWTEVPKDAPPSAIAEAVERAEAWISREETRQSGASSLSAAKAKSAQQKEAERLAKLRETRAGFAAETAPAPAAPEPHILTKPEGRSVINAYHHLAQKTGFPAVSIAELADQSGIPLDRLKAQLLRSQKSGSVVLSTGDWSLASDKVKSGAIDVAGQRPMLQVRFLNDAGGMAAAKAKRVANDPEDATGYGNGVVTHQGAAQFIKYGSKQEYLANNHPAGWRGFKWRYENGKVIWDDHHPDVEQTAAVENALDRKGLPVVTHVDWQTGRVITPSEQESSLFASKANADPVAARKEGIQEGKAAMQAKVEAVRAKERAKAQEAKQALRDKAAEKVAGLRNQMAEMIPKARALDEMVRVAKEADAAGRKGGVADTRSQLAARDAELTRDMRDLKDNLVAHVREALPPEERGHFIAQIGQLLTSRPDLLRGDADRPFRAALKLMGKIEAKGEQVHRDEVTDDIRGIVRKALDSPSVDVEYKKKLRALLGQHEFAKLSDAKRRELESRRAYVQRKEAAGEAHGVSDADLAELRRLDRSHISELTTDSLEALRDKAQNLADQGRLTVALRAGAEARHLQSDMQAMQQDESTPFELRPENADLPPLKQGETHSLKAMERIQNKYIELMNKRSVLGMALNPMDAVMDIIGAAKGLYKGFLFRKVRGVIDLDYNAKLAEKNDAFAGLDAIIAKHKLTGEDGRRIGVLAAANQEGGRERLIKAGIPEAHLDKIIASLTPGEMEAYRYMRDAMDAKFPELRTLMRELYNEDVIPVENYFPMIRDWHEYAKTQDLPAPVDPKSGLPVRQDELATWKNVVEDVRPTARTNVEKGMTISRLKGAATPIRIDAFEVWRRHMDDVLHLLHTQRDLKRIGKVMRSDQAAEKYGRAGRQIMVDWLDTIARNGGSEALKHIGWLDWLRQHSSVGMVGYRLVSQLKHISNAALAMHHVGLPWYIKGLSSVPTAEAEAFMRKNMAETFDRHGGEMGMEEIAKFSRIANVGFAGARFFDKYNAQAVALGSYFKAMVEKGYTPAEALHADVRNIRGSEASQLDRDAAAAVTDALVRMRRVVASAAPKDAPQVLSRGTGLGNNVSVSRTVFQFGNIFLDRWSNLRHDFYGAGIKQRNFGQASTVALGLLAAIAAESLITMGVRNSLNSLTGNHPPEEDNEFAKDMLVHGAKQFPFVGQIVGAWQHGGSGIPLVDSGAQIISSAKHAVEAKTPGKQAAGAVRSIGGAAALLGVPGAGQASDLAAKVLSRNEENDVQRIMREGQIKRTSEKPEGQPTHKDLVAQVRAGGKPMDVFKAGVATGMKAEQARSAVKEGMKTPDVATFEKLQLQPMIEVFRRAQTDPAISVETRKAMRAILQRKHAGVAQLKAA